MNVMILFGIVACLCVAYGAVDSVVKVDSGYVIGWERISRDGRVYQAWTGIPYAAPPTGHLRFKAPRPALKWHGVLDATGDPPACLQTIAVSGSSSEDCLFLNVYRPLISTRDLPVIFYVHGGAFQVGSAGPREVADYLMDEDVVLVRIQYRLGMFGFMSLGDSVLPGNFGMKDQVMALKWVKRNIAAFGGNPNSVTVIGESAGGASAHLLLKSPTCDDLVHRGVSESGTINHVWSLVKPGPVITLSHAVVEDLGCKEQNNSETLNCLQSLDASTILSATPKGIDPTEVTFLPVIEPEDAEDAFATSDLSIRPVKKPWITSTCTGEWGLILNNMAIRPGKNVKAYLRRFFSHPLFNMTEDRVNEVAKILNKVYFSSAKDPEERLKAAAKLQEDMYFQYPALANIERHEGPKWIYRFEFSNDVSRVLDAMVHIPEDTVFHATQAAAYLNMRSVYPSLLSREESPEDYKISKRLIKHLVNFAYYDDPTPYPSHRKWTQFCNYSDVLRVKLDGDYPADRATIEKLAGIDSLWNSILGW